MFTIETSDGIMEIKMTPGLNTKLTEEIFERLVVTKAAFYTIAHDGVLPSDSDIQTFIDDIITDFNKEEK